METPFSGITILQGNNITLSCRPSKLDMALQWSYNGNNIASSLIHYQFTPPFLNHDLTISHANDTNSGDYACAFKLRDKVIDQRTISLKVIPSEFE